MVLDKTDKYILKLLQDNSQVTVKEISIQTGLSTTPVFERIKRLEKNGFIKKYVAILDREKVDKGLMAFCSVVLKDHSKEAFKRFETEISKLPEIVECFKIAGSTDYLL
ncbi:MAG TPA: Lrp/AsnC family transcriptional regulator, partial [Bacteroidia bacterium]|nr:Lrp/AsnC family transcriptional regulator [Bacteroidia bacterium]